MDHPDTEADRRDKFKFYDKVYYHDPGQPFAETKEKCGYWLGVADHVGDVLCYCILTCDTHQVIHRSVVRSVQKDTALNKEAIFPVDDFAPDPQSDDLLNPEWASIDYRCCSIPNISPISVRWTRYPPNRIESSNQMVAYRPAFSAMVFIATPLAWLHHGFW
jgi:hypothetical protein